MGLVGGLVGLLFVFVVGLFIVASPRPLVRGVLVLTPPEYRERAARALGRIVSQLESWAVATLILMVAVGFLTWIGLRFVAHVPNALLFSVLAGFGEAVPTVGPIVTAIPPAVAAFADEPRKALWVAGVFLVVQQLENNLLVPFIMGRSLKLHPVSIMFFVLAFGSLLGVAGALLAVPATIVTKVLFDEFYAAPHAPAGDGALDAAAAGVVNPPKATA
jgi:predicted PurR-regulated permease PerM